MKLLNLALLAAIALPACATQKSSPETQRSPAKKATTQNDDRDRGYTNRDYNQNNNNNNNARTTDITTDMTDIVTPEAKPCIEADDFICDVEIRILELTNEFRVREGKPVVEGSPRIGWVSRDWSQSQADRGYIGHGGFPRQRDSLFQTKFNHQAGISAENVAYSSFRSDSVEEIASGFVNMWIGSSGHRRNMLANHKMLGVGVAKGSGGSYYATQIFGSSD